MKTVKIIITAIIAFNCCGTAIASGWPIGKHKAQLIPYYYYYLANAYRNKTGNVVKYLNNGVFTGVLLKQSIEYGIADRVSLLADIPFAFNKYKDDNITQRNKILTDIILGVKWNLYRNTARTSLVTSQLSTIIPAYRNDLNKQPVPGYALVGGEIRVIYSGTGRKAYGLFHNTEAALRLFSGSAQTVRQFHFISAVGLYLTKKNILSCDISGISSRGAQAIYNQSNPLQNTDYQFLKFSLQYGNQICKNFWLYAGLFSDVYNKNTGIGKGFSVFGVINL